MIELAVNDTPASRALHRVGRLDVDRIESTGPRVEDAPAAFRGRPLLLHNPVWDWSLAHPRAAEQGHALTAIRAGLTRTGAPWLSLHVGFASETVAYRDGMRPTSAILTRAATLERMVRNVHALRSQLTVPILLENLDYNDTGAYEHVCDPGYVRELIEASGADFLLDLAHAQVSASRLGWDARAYLAALPLERLRQVHVSGPRPRDGALFDAHERLRGFDVALLAELLDTSEPWAVTLEYGRDEEALPAEVARLRKVLAGTS